MVRTVPRLYDTTAPAAHLSYITSNKSIIRTGTKSIGKLAALSSGILWRYKRQLPVWCLHSPFSVMGINADLINRSTVFLHKLCLLITCRNVEDYSFRLGI